MKLYVDNATSLIKGLEYLSIELEIELVDKEKADIIVTVEECEKNYLSVSLDSNKASIIYGGGKSRFFRGLCILVDWISKGLTKQFVAQTPLFKMNGAMVDMSANVVLAPKTVKTMLRKLALMGMNSYMLYTEDTYELEKYPYFGHMRGRYTKDELKELDAYAAELGIELIPCIQTLGHLQSHLQWSSASPYRDTSNVLLVGAEETYELIEEMFRTVRECFSTKRVHIGMDETFDLGTGSYLKTNGYREKQEIFFEHLERVKKLAASYDLEPMMWSDMFFRLMGKDLSNYKEYDMRLEFNESDKAKTPKGVKQVFWDYYNAKEEFYSSNIKKHEYLFDNKPIFAGGVWLWSGHCPLYSRSLQFTVPALEACKKENIEEIFATVWVGTEGNLLLSLAGLAWYADFDYKNEFDIESVKACFERSCRGILYDDIMLYELPEHPDGEKLSLTRALLYNDPLIGLFDKHIEGLDTKAYYESVSQKLAATKKDKGIMSSACDVIEKLCALLENKADFGIRLKQAYDSRDKKALMLLRDECDTIIEKLKALRKSHKKAWIEYNKALGWEIQDMRYGSLIIRFETTKERITELLDGYIDHIDELDEKRLYFDGRQNDSNAPKFNGGFLWISPSKCASPNKH